MREAAFVHLHNHTEYSLLDGAARIKPLAHLAAEYRFPALAITDHGSLFGAIEFYKTVMGAGIKPIIGCEVYVAPRSRTEKTVHAEIPESSFHLTLLCESPEGYRNLVKLVSAGYLEGFYYRPRIDKELLTQHAKGLIAMSACLKGEVNHYLNRGECEKAKTAALELQECVGKGNFFLEVMRIGIPECAKVEAGAEQLGQELGIPLVATNDSHYLRRTDYEAHDALLCLQTGKRVKDKARLKFGTQECYLKSADEMIKLFRDKPQWIQNTLEIASRCNVLLEAEGRNFSLPVFPRPAEYETDFAYLSKQAREDLTRRLGMGTPLRVVSPELYQERLEHELNMIRRMGFSGYFLIVKDIVDYARRQGIPVGPGRGSAVGSLVLYALGITDLDPIRYGLIFERFLTAERVSLPDIDVDFADTRRAEVIAYIRQRYGEDCVAQIITYGTMGSKACVRDVGRVLDVPLPEVDRLAKLIPQDASLNAALSKSSELKQLVNSSPEYQRLWHIAQQLEGIARHASIHASGVVITPKPLTELVPLYKSSEGDVCTQYDMNALEAIGLLKLDVLGLRTLTVIDGARKLLQAQGVALDLENIPLDDTKTYNLLKRADVIGVFQLESAGMQNLLTRTLPENLEDIMAVISLYRPGPLGNVDLEDYIKRKSGAVTTKLMHPALDSVLKDTHGVIIYQEQVMKIANLVAGFSLSEADKLRRVMAKKIPELMAPMREKFVADAKRLHVSDKIARAIFDMIEPFAGYGFNKSHAAGYAVLSYRTAFLKANYPVEFMTAVLTSEIGNSDKLRKFVSEVRRARLTLLGPDVNASDYVFTIEPAPDNGQTADGPESESGVRKPKAESRKPLAPSPAIRFGLGGIKNLGQGICEGIVKERADKPYVSFSDFIARTRTFVNRKAYESLIMAGALDSFNPERQVLLDLLPKELEKASSARAALLDRQVSLFGAEPAPDKDYLPSALVGDTTRSGVPILRNGEPKQHHSFEKSALGFYLSSHPLEEFRLEMETLKCRPLDSLAANRGDATPSGVPMPDTILVAGVITARRFKSDKNGRDYAILQLEDLTGTIEVMVFSNVLENSRKLIRTDELVIVIGKIRTRGEGVASIWADSLMSLAQARSYLKTLTIRFRGAEVDETILFQLRKILEQHPGHADVFFQVREDGKDRTLRVRDVKVLPSTGLVRQLQSVPSVVSAKIGGALPIKQGYHSE
jgi:DNA polymerase-3 subunit alpha